MSRTGPSDGLSPAAWERIRELFADALDMQPEDRATFLGSACRDEPGLLGEVEALLAAHAKADTFLEVGAVTAMTPAADPRRETPGGGSDDAPVGSQRAAAGGIRLGPYRTIRELGRGGMGTVYLAERADERYERQVAIKLVATGPAGALARRFAKEQRILASLEHPSIARLYDAGATPEGTPYLVMEYVEGMRVDAYCDEAGLSIGDRLHLFDRICAAVEFAHGRLVVHQDLKPSNILVNADGAPKLLDFGVARLLEPEPQEGGESTTTGFLALTPEFASPEQLRGDPASTSSDVWALGVLLYRLLAGRHPYSFASRSPIQVERTLRERPPSRPSEAAIEAASAGGSALARRLRGDLDNIILMALRLEPERRYGTVAELRADIRAHLAGYPVSARPDTWRYRTGKFVRRNRVGLIAASVVSLSLLGGLTGIAWQGRVASRQAARAEATRDYLVGMFEALDPDDLRGQTLTVEQLLDLGASRLDAELAGQPVERSELAGVLGRMFQRLGLFEKARPLLERAHTDLLARYGEEHAGSALAASRLAALLHDEGQFVEAERLARSSLAARRRLYGSADTAVANALTSLAAIRSALGDFDEAEALQTEALAIDRDAGRQEAVATDLGNLGNVHLQRGEHDEARRLHAEALSIRRALYGTRDTRVATGLLNLAEVLVESGEYDDAITLLEESLSIRQELLGDEHPEVASALNNLGRAYQEKGDLDAAEAAHLKALEIRRSVFGEDHPEVAASLNNLGVIAYFQADYATAAGRFEQVAEIWRAQLGDDHPNVLAVLNNLGASLRAAGDLAEAERVLRQALDLRRRTLGEKHPDVAQSLNNLAAVLDAQGHDLEAEEMYREAIAAWRSSLGEDHPTVAFGLLGLGKLLRQTGRCEEAEAPLREAIALREAALDPASTDIAIVRYYLALCQLELGRPAEAESLLRAALPPIETRWGPDHEVSVGARQALERAVAAARDRS